jgi:hypothetical protein
MAKFGALGLAELGTLLSWLAGYTQLGLSALYLEQPEFGTTGIQTVHWVMGLYLLSVRIWVFLVFFFLVGEGSTGV